MVEFGPSVKTFNGKYLEKKISVYTKSTTDNKPYGFPPSELAASTRAQNTSSSTYIYI